MSLSRLFNKESSSRVIFEMFAAAGLFINAIVISNKVPINGKYLLSSSIFLFGFGAIGLALIYSLPHAESETQNFLRPVVAVYGGLGLGIIASASLASAVLLTNFNNLLAVIILAGFAYMYVSFWRRVKKYNKSDLWFHS